MSLVIIRIIGPKIMPNLWSSKLLQDLIYVSASARLSNIYWEVSGLPNGIFPGLFWEAKKKEKRLEEKIKKRKRIS